MPKYAVALVIAYDTPGSVEDAANDIRESFSFLEQPIVAYAAESLEELPPPRSVPEVAAIFAS